VELSIDDQSVSEPSAEAIAEAIKAGPHPAGWTIALDQDDGDMIEAAAETADGYRLRRVEHGLRHTAGALVDGRTLTRILTSYLAGDERWRSMCGWAVDGPVKASVAAKARGEPPAWAIGLVIGTIGLIYLVSMLPSDWLSALPFAHSSYGIVGLIALPIVVMVGAMIAHKLMQQRAARHWPSSFGRITSSGTTTRRQGVGEDARTITVPAVGYEFVAGGKTYHGSRISIGEDTGGANLAATLERYPAGAQVLVYYDPNDPTDCVLERDLPAGFGKGCLVLLGLLVAAIAGIVWLSNSGIDMLERQLPHGNAPLVIFAGLFGLACLVFSLAGWRHARRAADWPSVLGQVLSSGVVEVAHDADGRQTRRYAARIEYAYAVAGVDYRSNQIALGVTTSGSRAGAQAVADRYPAGASIEVHFDPANPSTAALENPTGFWWLPMLVGLFCLGVAAQQTGLFAGMRP